MTWMFVSYSIFYYIQLIILFLLLSFIVLDIRTSDRINPDGTVGFAPDLVVSPSADITDQLILKLKSGQFAKTSEQILVIPPRPSPSSSYISRPRENEYPLVYFSILLSSPSNPPPLCAFSRYVLQ